MGWHDREETRSQVSLHAEIGGQAGGVLSVADDILSEAGCVAILDVLGGLINILDRVHNVTDRIHVADAGIVCHVRGVLNVVDDILSDTGHVAVLDVLSGLVNILGSTLEVT
jgi:hypothetical protein